jgi:ABC-type transport system substrate-binding protein
VAATGPAKKGGSYNSVLNSEPASLDPYTFTGGAVRGAINLVMSRLFRIQSGPGIKVGDGKIIGDVVDTWQQPDNQTYILKIRDNVRFQPPVSRPATADDVLFTFQRLAGQVPGTPVGPGEGVYKNLIDSVTAPDAKTITIKTKRPYPLPSLLTSGNDILLFAKETGTAYDPTKTVVGTGPYVFDQYRPGVSVVLKRNPQWHFGPDLPYIDTQNHLVMVDTSVQETQFMGGNVDLLGGNTAFAEYPKMVTAVKGVQALIVPGQAAWHTAFSMRTQNVPWRDQRVRQAFSNALDKDAMNDVVYNPPKLKAAGLTWDPATAINIWDGVLTRMYGSVVLDPKTDTKISKYFKYDPQQAKQLLTAAGYPDGFSAKYTINATYGQREQTNAELIRDMVGKVGIKLDLNVVDNAVWAKTVYAADWDGIASPPHASVGDAGLMLEAEFYKGVGVNYAQVNDPDLNGRIEKILATTDTASRNQQIVDFQVAAAEKMYYVPSQVQHTILSMYQPWVRGFDQYTTGISFGGSADTLPYYWVDK